MICIFTDIFCDNDNFILDRPTEDNFIFVYDGEIVARSKDKEYLQRFRNMHIVNKSLAKLFEMVSMPLVCSDLLLFVGGVSVEDDICKLIRMKTQEIYDCKYFVFLDSNKSKSKSDYFKQIESLILKKRDSNPSEVRLFSFENILKNDIIQREFLSIGLSNGNQQ